MHETCVLALKKDHPGIEADAGAARKAGPIKGVMQPVTRVDERAAR